MTPIPDLIAKVRMLLPKITPGPWRYQPSTVTDGEFAITGSNEHGASRLPILGRTHNFPRHAESNAAIIALTPDLATTILALQDQVERKDAALAERDKAHECDAQIAADMISGLIARANTAEQSLEQARKALVSLEAASETACALRSDAAYQALLLCPGMADALLELDRARHDARAIVKGETNG